MPSPAHSHEGANGPGDSGAPIVSSLRVVPGAGGKPPVGEGLVPVAPQELKSADKIAQLAIDMGKARLPMRFTASEGGPFLSFEDLLQVMQERPIPPELRKKLEFLERFKLMPLTTHEAEVPGDKKGEVKIRERLILALNASKDSRGSAPTASVFDLEWREMILPVLKREMPKLREDRLDIVLVPDERYQELGRLIGDKDYRLRKLGKIDPDAKAEKAFEELVGAAVRDGASDIHIQCIDHGDYKVRFRINGVLRHVHTIRHETGKPLVQRLKINGDMKVDENRMPLDGRIFFTPQTIKNPEILRDVKGFSMRVSIVFGQQGATAVLRLLKSADEHSFKLERLGFRPHVLEGIEEVLQSPNGVVLVTGPTGSGKTSTLYAALKRLDDGEINILTAEDPVEVSLTGITQVQVNRAIELDFSHILRSFLRQDPDVILVGEIRDQETAEIAIQAALTGHLVFATVHTNDAFGTIQRLRSLGIDNSKLQDTIRAVLSQRLVRQLCCECKTCVDAAPELNKILGPNPDGAEPFRQPLMVYKQSGRTAGGALCKPCKGTGFAGGRFPVAEIWIPGLEERDLILDGNMRHEALVDAAVRGGMTPIMHSALMDVREGRTSLQECIASIFSVKDLRVRREDVIRILSGGGPGSH